MTAHEAIWLLKATLQKNEQNLEAIRVLEDIVNIVDGIHIDDNEKTYTLQEAIDYIEMGTEAEHIKNHMAKVGKKDIQELEKNMCARYDWAEDDDVVVYYDLCDTIGGEDD
jgi:hypothetical protein